ncbi:MAG: acyltransferase family protein [Clostridia bacterium]|nr:acyltransferase family protein [Clostridia bacterium]
MQKKSNTFDLCDKTHFGIAKGMGILIVILVHLTNRYLNFPVLSPVAGAMVAIFLICSGYGLSESFKYKNLSNYWGNKFVKIWVPSFIQVSIVALIGMVGLKVWLTNSPLFLYGWYLQVLFYDYALFWIAYKFVKNEKVSLGLLFAISIITFLLLKSQIYAEQLLCFPIGVAFSQLNLKNKVEKFSIIKSLMVLGLLVSVVVGVWLLRNTFNNYIMFNAVWLVIKTTFAIVTIYGIYVFRKIPLLKMFIPFGSMSYALYLLNNYTLKVLEKCEVNIWSVLFALALTFVSAFVYSKICDWIYKQYIVLKKEVKI